MRILWICLVAVALVFPASGCRKPKRVFTSQEREQVNENIMTALPEMTDLVKVGANFDDKIELVGYTLNRRHASAGDTILLTYYWKSLKALDGEFKIFMHLDSRNRKTFDHHGVGGLYPVARWQPGEVIRDQVVMNVDASFADGPASIWVGFFDERAWRDAQRNVRLPVKDAAGHRTDNGDRLLVASIFVGKVPDRNLSIPKTTSPVQIDGVLDEPVWEQAFQTMGPFFTPDGKEVPQAHQTRVAVTFDPEHLYIAFDVKDTDLVSPYTTRDSTLWTLDNNRGASDVVEVFLDPDGNGKNYIELQVSPANVVFDALFTSHRTPHWEKAREFNFPGIRHAVVADGTVNAPGEDKGYTVEIAIPWKDLPGVDGMPAADRIFRINFFRLSNSGMRAIAWAPVGNDFHDFSLAATLRFVP